MSCRSGIAHAGIPPYWGYSTPAVTFLGVLPSLRFAPDPSFCSVQDEWGSGLFSFLLTESFNMEIKQNLCLYIRLLHLSWYQHNQQQKKKSAEKAVHWIQEKGMAFNDTQYLHMLPKHIAAGHHWLTLWLEEKWLWCLVAGKTEDH